jgi:hypothetical protein
MKEPLITFETAKLAKEKGFDDVKTNHLPYMLEGDDKGRIGASIYCKVYANCCTQSFLQKWLREAHCINIFMTFKPNIKKWDFIPYFMSMDAKEYIEYNSNYTKQNNKRRFDTYEDALEIGLQEALKLIQK